VAIAPENGSSKEFAINFARESGVSYEVIADQARNLRGSGQWAKFTGRFEQANVAAIQPVIQRITNGSYHRFKQAPIKIHGTGFRNSPDLKVYVDQYSVPFDWIDENTLQIPAQALALVPLEVGQHHVRVLDNELTAEFPGAIVTGDDIDLTRFSISPETADLKGGHKVTVSASTGVILPGTKVIMRPVDGGQPIHSLESVIDLKDDVETLSTFTYRLPTSIEPKLYRVYLVMNGQEFLVGNVSYTLQAGRSIGLPNYPPHVIGGSTAVNDYLFVGVRAGAEPTDKNRFLIPSGLEIFDVSIWENPIRLSQVRTDAPVLGVEVVGNSAFLAASQKGLMLV